jgi:RNA polymerase sigma factor (sigma-70 family)
MKMTESLSLLADYVKTGSEPAFRELLTRYIDLVYSAAVRLVGGDTHLAQDVTQTVFIDLARKARRLPKDVMLGGWLHHHTVFVSATIVRGERRRQLRERQAVEMNALQDHTEANLAQLAPILDEAIDKLNSEDRTAILLCFFEQLDFRSVGEVLDSSEEAARKRVTRALDKLHVLLKHRGVTISAAGLGAALGTEAIAAAPAGMAASVAGTALANVAVGGVVSATLLELTTMTKLQAAIIGAVVVAGVATSLVFQQQAQVKLRQENESFHQQITQLESENEGLSNHVAQITRSTSPGSDRLRELLRLRGEVGLLRRQQRELELAAAAAQSKPPGVPGQSLFGVASQPNKPEPFQVQIVLSEPGEDSEAMTNNTSSGRGETLYVQKTPLLDHTAISSATVTTDTSTGAPQIDVEFSEVGRELFAAITKENINKRLAIVLDGQLYSAPVIRTEIPGGKAQITGSFTEQEARELAAKINDAITSK